MEILKLGEARSQEFKEVELMRFDGSWAKMDGIIDGPRKKLKYGSGNYTFFIVEDKSSHYIYRFKNER